METEGETDIEGTETETEREETTHSKGGPLKQRGHLKHFLN